MFWLFALTLVLGEAKIQSSTPPGTAGFTLSKTYPDTEVTVYFQPLVINGFPFYVDTLNTDGWITSLNCWTPWCLDKTSQGYPVYNGKTVSTHRSNGTITSLDSYNQSKILGLQMTNDIFIINSIGSGFIAVPNISFVEGYEINKTPDHSATTGLLGMGTIYGLQTTLTPFAYQLVSNGQVSESVFTLSYCPPGALIMGAPDDGNWNFIRGLNVVPNVPLAARDGTWNLMVKNLALNETALGFNGLSVIDALNPNITLPRAIARTVGNILGAISYTIDNVDFYNMPCINSDALPSLNITTQNGDLPIRPSYYYVESPPCYLRIIGKDIFSSTGNPIWNFGLPLLTSYVTTFNNTIGFETIDFNQPRC